MAWRLGELVECGELFNTRHYSTYGWLKLRGRDQRLRLDLTGNCDPDLRGWHIRFEARPPAHAASGPGDDATAEDKLSGLLWRQIGVTGTMTAARMVKVADCSVEELLMRCKLDEPPPFQWKPCLYLEWYGQNGRVLVELADPEIEHVESVEPDEGAAADASTEEPDAEDVRPSIPSLGITSIRIDDDGGVEIRDETITAGAPDDGPDAADDEPPDDPYGLFPSDLERHFEHQARETDRALGRDEDGDRVIREAELLDDLIENSPGEPLSSLVNATKMFPPPDQLDDKQAEAALKSVLAELALFGIALDLCEHFTPRDAYRLLVEEILPNETAFPELRGTEWVTHFMTAEYCDACAAEVERDWAESERRRGQEPTSEAPDDDDLPF